MTSQKTGRGIANQFIITEEGRGALGNFIERKTFQSYDSTIAIITKWEGKTEVQLDENYWEYSRTTSKYRNEFLGEDTQTTKAKIKSGEYKLVNLN